MKNIVAAAVILGLVALGSVSFADEDKIERAIREARELQARQNRDSLDAETWLKSPAGQKWQQSFKGSGPQESTYAGPTTISSWGQAVEFCRAQVSDASPKGNFSAFVPVNGRVTMLGTAEERYNFSACMAGLGVPVEKR